MKKLWTSSVRCSLIKKCMCIFWKKVKRWIIQHEKKWSGLKWGEWALLNWEKMELLSS